MRRRFIIGSVIALAMLWVLPAAADGNIDDTRYPGEVDVTKVDEEVDESEMKFRVTGQVRARFEYLTNYGNIAPDTQQGENYDLVPYRAQIGVLGRFTKNVYGYVDLQGFGYFGDSVPQRSYQSPSSQGQSTDRRGASAIELYQAFIDMKTIGGGGVDLRIGRAEHVLGNELHMGNSDFYNGTSFDGIRGWYNGSDDRWNVQAYYYWAIERNAGAGNLAVVGTPDIVPTGVPFQLFSNVDARQGGIDFTWNFNDEQSHFIKPYVLFTTSRYQTTTPPGAAGTPLPIPGGDTAGDHMINTFGILWKHEVREDRGIDWSVEIAGQNGQVTNPTATAPIASPDVDLGGTIFEGWVGYKFAGAHRIRLGGLLASGSDPNDPATEFNGWIPLWTDVHQDNRLGNLDLFAGNLFVTGIPTPLTMSNVTNYNLRYEYTRGKNYILAAFHSFGFTEDIAQTPPGGTPQMVSSIGQEIDLEWRYQYSKLLGLEIAYSYLLPGDFFDNKFATGTDANEITRFWLGANLKW